MLSFLVPFLIGLGLGDSHLVTLFLFSLALFLCNLCFLCFLFADVPSLLYFCFADAYLHLAVFLIILSLTYPKKKKKKKSEICILEKNYSISLGNLRVFVAFIWSKWLLLKVGLIWPLSRLYFSWQSHLPPISIAFFNCFVLHIAGWLECPAAGQEVCGVMIPSKVPLGESYNDNVPPGKRYSFKQVIHQQRVLGRKVSNPRFWRFFCSPPPPSQIASSMKFSKVRELSSFRKGRILCLTWK